MDWKVDAIGRLLFIFLDRRMVCGWGKDIRLETQFGNFQCGSLYMYLASSSAKESMHAYTESTETELQAWCGVGKMVVKSCAPFSVSLKIFK